MKNNKVKLRLKFYNQVDPKIRECLELIQQADHRIAGWRIEATQDSSSAPNQPTHIVALLFRNKTDRQKVQGNGEVKRLYQRYAFGRNISDRVVA